MMEGIQWNPTSDGARTTLSIQCRPEGSIHMESDGGYRGDFQSPDEAAQSLVSLFEDGLAQAKQ